MRNLINNYKLLAHYDKFVLWLSVSIYIALFIRFSSHLGDFDDFVFAGSMIWSKQNPYSALMYVNSPVSAILLFAVNKVLPFIFFPFFIQMLNVVGLLYFYSRVARQVSTHVLLWIFALLSLTNVARSLFGNVQVTGLVLGLWGLAVHASRRSLPSFIIILPLFLALELKPQLSIPFILYFLYTNKTNWIWGLILSFYLVISHATVEFIFNGPINKFWIEKVLRYSSASFKEGYEISIWKNLSLYFGQEHLIRIVASFASLLFLIAIVYYASQKREDIALTLVLLYPIANSYVHLYDLSALFLMVCGYFLSNKKILEGLTVFLFFQVYPLRPHSQLIYLTIVIISFLFYVKKIQFSLKVVLLFMLGLIFLIVIWILSQGLSEERQIASSLMIPLMFYFMFNRLKISQIFNQVRL